MQRLFRGAAEDYLPFLAALAAHQGRPFAEFQVGQIHVVDFRQADAAGIQQFQNRLVAQAGGRFLIGGVHQPGGLPVGQESGQRLAYLEAEAAARRHRGRAEQPLLHQKAVESAQHGELARHADPRVALAAVPGRGGQPGQIGPQRGAVHIGQRQALAAQVFAKGLQVGHIAAFGVFRQPPLAADMAGKAAQIEVHLPHAGRIGPGFRGRRRCARIRFRYGRRLPRPRCGGWRCYRRGDDGRLRRAQFGGCRRGWGGRFRWAQFAAAVGPEGGVGGGGEAAQRFSGQRRRPPRFPAAGLPARRSWCRR